MEVDLRFSRDVDTLLGRGREEPGARERPWRGLGGWCVRSGPGSRATHRASRRGEALEVEDFVDAREVSLCGGYIIIGQACDADGKPVFPSVGVQKARLDRIQLELLAHCQQIQPPYFPIVSVEQVDGRNLIATRAHGGTNRPLQSAAIRDRPAQ